MDCRGEIAHICCAYICIDVDFAVIYILLKRISLHYMSNYSYDLQAKKSCFSVAIRRMGYVRAAAYYKSPIGEPHNYLFLWYLSYISHNLSNGIVVFFVALCWFYVVLPVFRHILIMCIWERECSGVRLYNIYSVWRSSLPFDQRSQQRSIYRRFVLIVYKVWFPLSGPTEPSKKKRKP